MPITPQFHLTQSSTHVHLDIRVPHVRVTPESIQVVIDTPPPEPATEPTPSSPLRIPTASSSSSSSTTISTLHFSSPPYLLMLHFPYYRFHETASEACASYEPTIQNGTVRLSLKKAIEGQEWENLDLLGQWMGTRKPFPPSDNSTILPTTSRWLKEVRTNNDDNLENGMDEGGPGNDDTNDPPAQQQTNSISGGGGGVPMEATPLGHDNGSEATSDDNVHDKGRTILDENGYGFYRLYRGIYADLTRDGLAKEMLEMPWNEDSSTSPATGVAAPPSSHDSDNNTGIVLPTYNHDNEDENATNIHVERRQLRQSVEDEKFDPDRYLQDLDIHDDYVYQCAMDVQPHWRQAAEAASSIEEQNPSNHITSNGNGDDDDEVLNNQLSNLTLSQTKQNTKDASSSTLPYFTAEERQQLASIPYPLLPTMIHDGDVHRLVAGLVDILFAYVYDHLTTMGDATVESAWTISTISALLAWMDDWLDDDNLNAGDDNEERMRTSSSSLLISAVGRSCLRRSLVYPYLRNFDFACHCLQQVQQILAQGVRCVIRCLLQTRTILDCSELYYLGNKVWIDPYLAWLQRDAKTISRVLKTYAHRWPAWTKEQLGLHLIDLETRLLDQGEGGDSSEQEGSDSEDESEDSSEDEESEGGSSASGNIDEAARLAISTDLLDKNLRQSILQVGVTDSCQEPASTPVVHERQRFLIEEVE